MQILTSFKNKRPWRLILATEAFSSLANQFMQILLPWYVLSSTGSVLWTGAVAFCALLPNILSSLFGASVVDKFGRSSCMLFCEAVQFTLIISIPLLIMLDFAPPALIALLIFLSSIFDAPGQLSRKAQYATFSRYAGVPLSKTSGLAEAFDGMMSVIGPVLGGVIIAGYGVLSAWMFCALCCFIIVGLCLLLYTGRKNRLKKPYVSFQETWTHLRQDPLLKHVILFTLPTFILSESWELLLLPTYIYQHGFSALYLGTLGAAFGLGAFLGAVVFASAAKRFRFFTLLTFNYMGYLLSVAVLIFCLPKAWVTVSTMLCGIPFGAFGAMVTSIILLRTPEHLRSKTLGIFSAATYTVESLSVLGIACCIHFAGLNKTLLTAAAIFAILIVASFCTRENTDIWSRLHDEKKEPFTN